MSSSSDVTGSTSAVVDLVAIKPEGDVILGLVFLGLRDEKQQHLDLQERVNVYITYWDSGQLVADFPEAAWKYVTIRVMLDRKPGSEAQWFLAELAKLVKTLGIGFEYQMLEGES